MQFFYLTCIFQVGPIYFQRVDKNGHIYGAGSDEAYASLKLIDGEITHLLVLTLITRSVTSPPFKQINHRKNTRF